MIMYFMSYDNRKGAFRKLYETPEEQKQPCTTFPMHFEVTLSPNRSAQSTTGELGSASLSRST